VDAEAIVACVEARDARHARAAAALRGYAARCRETVAAGGELAAALRDLEPDDDLLAAAAADASARAVAVCARRDLAAPPASAAAAAAAAAVGAPVFGALADAADAVVVGLEYEKDAVRRAALDALQELRDRTPPPPGDAPADSDGARVAAAWGTTRSPALLRLAAAQKAAVQAALRGLVDAFGKTAADLAAAADAARPVFDTRPPVDDAPVPVDAAAPPAYAPSAPRASGAAPAASASAPPASARSDSDDDNPFGP